MVFIYTLIFMIIMIIVYPLAYILGFLLVFLFTLLIANFIEIFDPFFLLVLIFLVILPFAITYYYINNKINKRINQDLRDIAPISDFTIGPLNIGLIIDGIRIQFMPHFLSKADFTFSVPNYKEENGSVWMEYLNGVLITRIEDKKIQKRKE